MSYVAVVTVKVFGVTITVVRSETGRVRVSLRVSVGKRFVILLNYHIKYHIDFILS